MPKQMFWGEWLWAIGVGCTVVVSRRTGRYLGGPRRQWRGKIATVADHPHCETILISHWQMLQIDTRRLTSCRDETRVIYLQKGRGEKKKTTRKKKVAGTIGTTEAGPGGIGKPWLMFAHLCSGGCRLRVAQVLFLGHWDPKWKEGEHVTA